MKVFIGPYKNWVGPYQLAEMLFFWVKKYDEKYDEKYEHTEAYDRVHNFGKWLSKDKNGDDSYLSRFCSWVHSKQTRTVKIKIHEYDVWNLDDTLVKITLPMLLKLKECKQGSGLIALEDVPEDLRGTDTEEYDDQKCFDFYRDETDVQKDKADIHTRYNWVLDEMIWAFNELNEGTWEDQYFGKNGSSDTEAYMKHHKRIQNGLRLFGTYMSTLWD
jgi:hypothetical protein